MSFSHNKMSMYMLIIAISIDFILPLPILQHKEVSNVDNGVQSSVLNEQRFSRQVVQPTWLNMGKEPARDPTVYINQRSLEEADEIRRAIQKAVNENTFAVPDEQQYLNVQEPPQPMHSLPNWYLSLQKQFQSWLQILFKGFRNYVKVIFS